MTATDNTPSVSRGAGALGVFGLLGIAVFIVTAPHSTLQMVGLSAFLVVYLATAFRFYIRRMDG